MTRAALDAARPYPPSWIDRLVRWIEGGRVPAWVVYAVLAVLLALASHVVLWLDGALAVGTFVPLRLADGGYEVFFLALYHHLYRVAGRSFRQFQPLLDADEAALRAQAYRLTTLPRAQGWLTGLIGLVLAVIALRSDPRSFGLAGNLTPWPAIYQHVVVTIAFASMFALVLQSLRQLRLVNGFHQQATGLNLFRLGPAQALSRLTAQTGIGLVLFIAFSLVVEGPNIDALNVTFLVLMGLLAAVVFVSPLLGMRNRLSTEKSRLLDEVNHRLQVTLEHVHQRVDGGEHEAVGHLRTTLGTLTDERQLIKSISTWPWEAGTLRGFATTLLLPIVIWLVTRLLARFV